jgi:hypothetical protein
MRGQKPVVGAFQIAGITCQIECRDAAFWDLLPSPYPEFATDAAPHISLRVDVTRSPADQPAARWSGPFARVDGTDGVLSIRGAGFHGRFDERSGRGFIEQPLDRSPFETFLTAIYASRLLREGGFLLHAAAIVGPDGARVFFGPSGSGKTTVAELVGAGVISDEVVAIRRHGDRYRVSGVPWRGTPLSAELAALCRLRQASQTSFTVLAPLESIRQLLPSVFFSRPDLSEVPRFFEIGGDLAKAVPCYEMRFRPDRSFWDAIPRRGQGETYGHAL